MTNRWLRDRAERRALAVVAVVGITALVVLLVIVLAFPGPEPHTVPYEVMRVCVQVLGISVVGFFVGWAAFDLQQDRLERQRRDDRIRVFLAEMLDAYHGVKQVRRVLRSETSSDTARTISDEAYSRLLAELSKHQLVFETLARSAPLFEGHVPGSSEIHVEKAGNSNGQTRKPVTQSLARHYEDIESYLNGVVSEFEVCHPPAPGTGYVSLAKPGLDKTNNFLYDTAEFKARSLAASAPL
ncbi:hypothetical protein [Streptomyces chartreusis]